MQRLHDGGVRDLVDVGLGLDYDHLRFERATEAWLAAGARLRDSVALELGDAVVEVEQIGSSSVVGLLAKPIVDLAVGAGLHIDLPAVTRTLEDAGWIYRGDARESGGHVFVLEARPWHRIAHLHVVVHGGRQWVEYLLLRELLRRQPEARARYESVKLNLERQGVDRATYQAAKAEVVNELLAGA